MCWRNMIRQCNQGIIHYTQRIIQCVSKEYENIAREYGNTALEGYEIYNHCIGNIINFHEICTEDAMRMYTSTCIETMIMKMQWRK